MNIYLLQRSIHSFEPLRMVNRASLQSKINNQ